MADNASRPDQHGRWNDLREEDRAALESALAILSMAGVPAGIACVSLSLEDADERIGRLSATGMRVLVLAGRAHVAARRAALKAGTFEFLTTGPIQPAELAARIQLIQTGSALPSDVSLDGQQLMLAGNSHELTQREAEIMMLLIEAKGGFVTHERLLALWGRHASERQYLRVAMRKLRHRIEPEPDLPRFLLSEAAIGYRMGTGMAPLPA